MAVSLPAPPYELRVCFTPSNLSLHLAGSFFSTHSALAPGSRPQWKAKKNVPEPLNTVPGRPMGWLNR